MAREHEREDGVQVDPEVRLARMLWDDPKTRPMMEEAVATLNPERAAVAVPAHALRQEFHKERDEFRKERDEWRAEQAKEKETAESHRLAQQWRSGLLQAGAREDEVKPIYEHAVKKRIGDPEAAVDNYRKAQQLAAPTPGRFGAQMPGEKAGEFFKGLTPEGADQWARDGAARDIHIIKTHGLDALERLAPSPLR